MIAVASEIKGVIPRLPVEPVNTEAAIIALLRELRSSGHLILISTHDLGSVPEFCDRVVLINRTVLAAGPTAEVFTHANLEHVFGGRSGHERARQ